jgi:hypothetical protein
MIRRHTTIGGEEQYREMRKIEKIIHRKKKKYFEEKGKQIEKVHEVKESRTMYRLVNDIRKELKPHTTACRENIGVILNETFEIMER